MEKENKIYILLDIQTNTIIKKGCYNEIIQEYNDLFLDDDSETYKNETREIYKIEKKV